MLQRYGMTVAPTTLSAKNVAVVMVTADIPAFVKPGTRLDVQVSSMGDAKTLQGGVLLQTPLFGADNKVTPSHRDPCPSAASSPEPAAAAGHRHQKPSHRRPDHRRRHRRSVKYPPPSSGIIRSSCCCANRDSPPRPAMAAAINEIFTNSAHAMDSTAVRVEIPVDIEASPVTSSPDWRASK